MFKRILSGLAVVLLAAGVLVAADNSWRYPVPSLGGILTGDLIYAQSGNALGNINAVASGQVLTSAGASTKPSWNASPSLTGATFSGLTASKPVFSDASKALTSSGTMPVDQGGTNVTSYSTGDLLYASAATTLSKLAAVATGQVLVSAGANTAPAYSANADLTGYFAGTELTPPAAPSANGWRLYASDVGGKTTLYVIFASGAAREVATQP